MISLGLGLWSTTILSRGGSTFSPAILFAGGEVGVWYDPSDLSTLSQDTAGTTPVTTPGQTVALMLDKSGNDLNATQPTAAARPTYGIVPAGGRRNLLGYTEQFDDAYWTKSNGAITANVATAPNGTMTADKFIPTTATAASVGRSLATVTSAAFTNSVYVKSAGFEWCALIDAQGNKRAYFNLLTGAFGTIQAGITGTSVVDEGDGWYRISVTSTATFTSLFVGPADGNGSPAVTGDGTSGIFIWGAQHEPGSTATAYQKVTTAFDVTEAGVESLGYLSFDGIDDWMVTPTITPGTDKVQVFAGVRKLSTGLALIAEWGPTRTSGTFWVASDRSVNGTYGFRSVGTLSGEVVASGYGTSTAHAFTGLGDISGDLSTLRIDGTQVAQSTADQGTGNYRTDPLYLGARSGPSLPFNGQIYSLITRFGPNLEVAQIESTEAYVAGKTAGVTL